MSNQPTIQCLRFDHSTNISVLQLKPGDLIRQDSEMAVVTKEPYRSDGAIHVPSQQYREENVMLMFGAEGTEAITRVIDYVGGCLYEFADGTCLIADLAHGPGYVFSPRLALEELEAFCQEHLGRYEAFYAKHQTTIDDGQLVPMRPFWGTTAGINNGEVAANDE